MPIIEPTNVIGEVGVGKVCQVELILVNMAWSTVPVGKPSEESGKCSHTSWVLAITNHLSCMYTVHHNIRRLLRSAEDKSHASGFAWRPISCETATSCDPFSQSLGKTSRLYESLSQVRGTAVLRRTVNVTHLGSQRPVTGMIRFTDQHRRNL